MTFEPASGEGTHRHHGEAVNGCEVDRRGDEGAADSHAFEIIGDLGVDQHEPVAVTPVRELGGVSVDRRFETAGGLVVHDVHQPNATACRTEARENV
jgi:hypothetical protein